MSESLEGENKKRKKWCQQGHSKRFSFSFRESFGPCWAQFFEKQRKGTLSTNELAQPINLKLREITCFKGNYNMTHWALA